jgi:molybdopterin/thiamine biosynthesis adenylyltransferase
VPEERLDRQLRIQGWDQRALEEARIAVVGDDDLLASLYVLSSSALGLRNFIILAPGLDPALREIAERLNPTLSIHFLEGYYSHPALGDLFAGCDAIVDLAHYGLADKLLLEKGFREGIPVLRAFCYERGDEQGFKIFTYLRGREWEELREIVSGENLPRDHFDDGALDIIAAGIALEETKNLLMDRRTSEEVIAYRRPKPKGNGYGADVCVVGAGALGNFAGLGLLYSGFRNITFLDPDAVEVANLNRQVLLADSVGSNKAEALAGTLNRMFGTEVRGVEARFERDTDISGYDIVFDCVDNFETKIVLSERCREQHKTLISGGTGVEAGQVVVYDPMRHTETPAEVLGLYEIVGDRGKAHPADRTSCAYAPDPSVIMTNQIIAGLMVDSLRRLVDGQDAVSIFYDASSDTRF